MIGGQLKRLPKRSMLVAIFCICSIPLTVTAGGQYYRYTNDQGVIVITRSIPPEYVNKGYQVVTLGGDVVRTVAPSVSAEDIERKKAEKKRQLEWQAIERELLKRYSRVEDIEAAKQRKLDSIQGYIAILRGNLHSISSQIAKQHANAADAERAGIKVSEAILKSLDALKLEQARTREELQQREQEIEAITARFEEEKALFEKIRPSTDTTSSVAH